MKYRIIYILLLLFITVTTYAQDIRLVSGVIKDNDGEPIIGVSVQQVGGTNATITNLDGYYEIEAPLGSKLRISYIGMNTTEMVVTEDNSKPVKRLPNNTLSKSESPYFQVFSESKDASMPLKKTDVTVNIAGVIADVKVNQIYINDGPNTLEAIYVFPGSTRAAVYGMAMTVGNRRIEAKIKKKEQARQEYEQAKQEGKSTTLLEQHRPNVFQMNVANILPGDTITVEMRYTELLENEKGTYEFVYPTVVGPRYSTSGEEWVKQSTAQYLKEEQPEFSINTIIQAGMPIRKVSSISHNLTIESKSPDQAVISLSNPKDNEGNRDYVLQYELQGGNVESGLLRYEHGDENFFLLMVQPPKQPTLDQIPPREYVFIIDVSGSMYGFPLDVSKKLIRTLVASLRPIDRFNVMLFESSNAMLYKESVPATEKNIEKALAIIDKQQGNGGTEMYGAVKNAMEFKGTEGFSRTFLIITDGYVSVEKELFNYIRSHLNDANLFPFGIGANVNRYLIEGLAHAGMGNPYIITNKTQAKEVGQQAINDITQPVLTNISVDWGDFDVYDVEPVAIPDVFAQRPILIYGKYKGAAKGTITVEGISGNSTYQQKFKISDARIQHNQALRYLWARNQIRYYDDYAQYYEGNVNGWYDIYGKHSLSERQVEQITNLGLQYNLLTQYTSFLAVDDEVRTTNSQNTSDIKLTEDAATLDEVVVVGYGVMRKEYTASAVSSVSSSNLPTGSVGHSLQGRVAGLQISQTAGEPGDPARIRIRGGSSIMDNSTPLIVVDGLPVEYSDLSQMNTSDIESITVLKDASSTAIYGSRAANGVLVVTTKKPLYKALSVNWTSAFQIENTNRLPKLENQSDDRYDIFKTGYSFKNFLTVSEQRQKLYYTLKLGNNTQNGFIPKSKFNENNLGLKVGGKVNSKFDYTIDLNYKNTQGNRLQRGYNMSNIMQSILLSPSAAVDDPQWTIDNNPFKDEASRFTGNAKLTYKLLNNLSFDYQLNGDYLSSEARTALNIGSAYNPTGHIMERDEEFKFLQSRLSVKFNKDWNDIELNALAGHEYNNSKRTIDRLDGYELLQPGHYNLSNATEIVPYNQVFKRHSNAIFGRAALQYQNLLSLEAAMRGEWSSVSDKTLLSPSAGLYFNLLELFRSNWFNQIKLFANVSRADKETPLYLDPVYFNSAIYNLNDASSHFEGREVILDKLKPETIMHYEVGTQLAVWRNRLTLAASLYWKKGTNQLLPTQLSASSVQLENCGTFKRHGLEVELGAHLIENRNFSWYTRFIFSRERSRVTDLGGRKLMLAGIEGVAGSYAIEGQPLGVLYSSDEQKVLGNPNPDWQLSFMNSLNYRNFSLSVLLDYKKGGKMWNGTRYVMQAYNTAEEGIEDAGYLKLREVSLGYRIPMRLLGTRSQLKLSVFAGNILLYSKYKGVDPETNLTGSSNGYGLDYFNIPGTRNMGLSLSWEF
ncbi:VIT domain-containing protein [Bacteroides sp. 519]|uniref:VIT domain-containing protein n=1 Tax=Bacteroides sp. 519 TaxID=2302937 RepID=UPI0013D1C75A|nr:VIT domain-containing protein [Bacteroides sp. 519]NDV59415.1 VWA domain-containing protein [Bacteroides sp. 519]